MYQKVVNNYQQANFYTANPVKLVLICYDRAISSLKLARDSYLVKDYEAKAKALQRSLDIIHELNASLNMQNGGEIAANLRSLYHYIIRILIASDMKRDTDGFDRAIRILEDLESAWKAIAAPAGGVDNRVGKQPGMQDSAAESVAAATRRRVSV